MFDAMVDAFPDADLLCLWNDVPGRYLDRGLRETWLARTPLRRSKVSALPFMPATWRRRGSSGYDWALVSSHLFAHHVSFRGQSSDFRKLVYVHSPARYLWDPELDARGASVVARLVGAPLRQLDRRRAGEISAAAANSHFVAARIERTWGVGSSVIYPPVAVEEIAEVGRWADVVPTAESAVLDELPAEFVLGASRLVPYKRMPLVIRAGEAAGLPVVIAGRGPERAHLESMAAEATVPVMFLEAPSDALLYALYEACTAFVFPAVEDFGIMPVEAMAAGAAVVAAGVGGTLETVIEGVSGVHVDFKDQAALGEAVRTASSLRGRLPRQSVRRFSRERFTEEIRAFVASGSS